MLVDASIIAMLLVVGHLLRARVPWLQYGLVPSSMVAGVLGLIFGPQCFDLLPFTPLDASGDSALAISRWPAVLVIAVFGTLLLGHRQAAGSVPARMRRVKPVITYNLAAELGQFAIALLLGTLFLQAFASGLPSQLPVMLPAGFAGGAATSTVFAQGFEAQGWHDALSIGFAFATIGQVVAIVGGMMLVNLGVRRKWVSGDSSAIQWTPRVTGAFIDDPEAQPASVVTVNPLALDPLAWHLALLGAVYGLTISADAAIHRVIPGSFMIPAFSIAMLVGAGLQACLELGGVGRYVDPLTMRRLGSTCADILIVCSIASIRLNVVSEFAGPILALAILGTLFSLVIFLLGKWAFPDCWFERSLFTFGWMTGVVGTSVALVRIVDPRHESSAVEDYGTAYLAIGPIEMILYPVVIWACGAQRMTALGVVLAVLAIVLLIAGKFSVSHRIATANRPATSESILEAPAVL